MKHPRERYNEYKDIVDRSFGGLDEAITDYIEWLEEQCEANGVDNDGNLMHYGYR